VTLHVTITLSNPVNGVFTTMTTASAGNATMTWTYPSLWPTNAF
jgi:hypothetical protein